MAPVGHTIYLWRIQRNLTQAELAGLCGVSRPNLSAIEQGARDLTVQTLRRLAAALNVNTGLLADGITPYQAKSPVRWDRTQLDRIGRLAAGQSLAASPEEKKIARDLSSIMDAKIHRSAGKNSVSKNKMVLELKARLGPEIFKHLIRRVEKNLL